MLSRRQAELGLSRGVECDFGQSIVSRASIDIIERPIGVKEFTGKKRFHAVCGRRGHEQMPLRVELSSAALHQCFGHDVPCHIVHDARRGEIPILHMIRTFFDRDLLNRFGNNEVHIRIPLAMGMTS